MKNEEFVMGKMLLRLGMVLLSFVFCMVLVILLWKNMIVVNGLFFLVFLIFLVVMR